MIFKLKPVLLDKIWGARTWKKPMRHSYLTMAVMGVGMSYIFAIILGFGLLGVFIGFALDEHKEYY